VNDSPTGFSAIPHIRKLSSTEAVYTHTMLLYINQQQYHKNVLMWKDHKDTIKDTLLEHTVLFQVE
jgi:hypothetical protein